MSSEENVLVEEFPKPPRYYECFQIDASQLHEFGLNQPPPIPTISSPSEDIYTSVYDGSFAKNRLPSMASINPEDTFDENYDYRNEIKR